MRRGLRRRTPARLELVYLPFYEFRVAVAAQSPEPVLIDAVEGSVLFRESPSMGGEVISQLEPHEPELAPDEAQRLLSQALSRQFLQRNLAHSFDVEIPPPEMVAVRLLPYWLGYYIGRRLSVAVVDARSGERAGAKIKRLLLKTCLQS